MMTKREHYLNALDRASEGFSLVGELGNGNFLVYSHTDHIYEIEAENGEVFACDCPHSFWRNCCCKHMVFVAEIAGLEIDYLLTLDIY